MIRLLTAVFLFTSFNAVADTEVPHTFEDGTPASAKEVNENFDALEAAIDAIPEGPAGPQGEQGIQGEKGDKGDTGDTGPQGAVGNNGAPGIQGDKGDKGDTGDQGPAGADGVAAGLSCSADEIIKWTGSAWVCASPVLRTSGYVFSAYGSLSCELGEKVTGGGCKFRGLEYCDSTESKPETGLSGWLCEASGVGRCEVERIYAICQ